MRDGGRLINGGGDENDFPGDARCVGGQQVLFEPRELRKAQHGAGGIVRARAGVVYAGAGEQPAVAVGAVIERDEDGVFSPLAGVVLLERAVGAGVKRCVIEERGGRALVADGEVIGVRLEKRFECRRLVDEACG